MKHIVCGGPGSDLTGFANELSARFVLPVLHTEDLAPLPWSSQSDVGRRWLDRDEHIIIEGAAAVRALRKWLKFWPGKAFDGVVYWIERRSGNELADGEERMRKGTRTIWEEVQGLLAERHTDIRVIY